ncbi:hypothetical protein AB0M20_01250 [Actinoplanes sp. NPDC051633]|uniref:hypothetical protein n=1 Tax=Actinoplanes sp. NPDC051633 TaxID=3155670 RepID=UPI00343F8148
MRRLVVSVLLASGLVMVGAGTAFAEDAGAGAAQAQAGKKVCKVSDERLDELSGIVAVDDGFIVINDSTLKASHKRVFFLDNKCNVDKTVSFSGSGPRDTEDMVLSPDGETLWIADIGDNKKDRETIALWSMPVDGSDRPELFRMRYPDGGHDAEALLLNGDGTPIIVTKEIGRAATLYTPTAKLKKNSDAGVALKKAGEVTVPPSNTAGNSVSRLFKGTIDGGAVAPGTTKVVLRTYLDALEWPVTGGDVLAALKATPRVTPLPNEPLGEAITYSPDGKYFYTVSDMQGEPETGDNYILRYTPVANVATTKAAAGGAAAAPKDGPSWFANLSINDITYLVGGVGVLGAILVGFGVFGIRQARKKPAPDPVLKSTKGDGPKPADAETELLSVGGAAAGPGVYGGAKPRAGGPVYGAKPAGAKPAAGGPGVYGGSRTPAGAGAGRPPVNGARPPQGQPRPPQGGRPPQGQPRPPQGQPRPPQGQPRPQQSQPRPPQGGQPRPPQGQPRPPQSQPRPPQGGRPAQGQPRPPQGQPRPPQGGGAYGPPPNRGDGRDRDIDGRAPYGR